MSKERVNLHFRDTAGHRLGTIRVPVVNESIDVFDAEVLAELNRVNPRTIVELHRLLFKKHRTLYTDEGVYESLDALVARGQAKRIGDGWIAI